MTSNLLILFGLHFFADFILQSREMGKKKSVEFKWLFYHFGILWIVFFVGICLMLDLNGIKPSPESTRILLALCVGIPLIHCFQDWFIWKGYKAYIKWNWISHNETKEFVDYYFDTKFKYWEDKAFYTTIGIDQFLHYATITLIYNLVM